MQLPAHEALQSALKLLQQSFSPAHHESQKQPLGACEKQIPEHSPAAADRTMARTKRTTRVMVIALPRYSAAAARERLAQQLHTTTARLDKFPTAAQKQASIHCRYFTELPWFRACEGTNTSGGRVAWRTAWGSAAASFWRRCLLLP